MYGKPETRVTRLKSLDGVVMSKLKISLSSSAASIGFELVGTNACV